MAIRTDKKNKFYNRIHRESREKSSLLRVMFELTYRCNFYCPHCYIPLSYRKKKELNTRQVFSILDQLKDTGCFYLGFTGGEPFIRNDSLKIFKYAKRCGFEIMIYTNGSLIDESLAKKLACLRPNKIDITLPGMSELVFEKISKVKSSHRKTFRAIEHLLKNKINLGLKACLLKDNEREIEQMFEFASKLKINMRLDDVLSRKFDGSSEPYSQRGALAHSLDIKLSNHKITEGCLISQSKDRESMDLNDFDIFHCGVGRNLASITPSGELQMCQMIQEPSYSLLGKHLNIKKAWKKLQEFAGSIQLGNSYPCFNCELSSYCKRCPAVSWLYNRNFEDCDPEIKTLASRRRALLAKTHHV